MPDPATPPTPDASPPAPPPGRLPDWGPPYVETPPDPLAPDAPLIAEPWNTVTATFFIWIALWWLWRVRHRYRDFPFLVSCMPILLGGGVGGALFHGTRRSVFFFLLDVIPISLLGLAGAGYMAYRYFGRRRAGQMLLLLMAFYLAFNGLFVSTLRAANRPLSINLSYASLAVVVLVPVGLVLWRTRFRHGGWVVVGLLSFAIAWFFRLYDGQSAAYLSMGSHWLWHTFGAISTAAMIQYFYLVEGEAPPGGMPIPAAERAAG